MAQKFQDGEADVREDGEAEDAEEQEQRGHGRDDGDAEEKLTTRSAPPLARALPSSSAFTPPQSSTEMFTPRTKLFSATMKADKTSLELAIIEAYAHLEDSKPSPTDGGTTFSRFSNGERNWTVPVTLVPLGGRFAARGGRLLRHCTGFPRYPNQGSMESARFTVKKYLDSNT